MPSGEYNCGSRPLNTTRSNPDSTPLINKAKRCKKVFIGASECKRTFGHYPFCAWSTEFQDGFRRLDRATPTSGRSAVPDCFLCVLGVSVVQSRWRLGRAVNQGVQ